MGITEQRDGALVLNGCPLRARNQLVEQRKGVAHRAAAGTHDEGQHASLDLHLLALTELLNVLEHLRGRHEAERIVVRSRPNRADDLLGLGRRKDKFDVLRRLFDDLEQRVEALRRDHVRLVEDEDLVSIAGRREDGTLAQVASVVDSVVACRVDLDHIHRASTVAAELDATRAHSARGVGRALDAIETAGQNSSGCGLAASAGTAEKIGVIDPVISQRRAERIGHLGLADEFGKRLWPITAIQGGNHASRLPGATDRPFLQSYGGSG